MTPPVDVNRCERNFTKMMTLLPGLDRLPFHATAIAPGMQELHIFVFEKSKGYRLIQLSHQKLDSGRSGEVSRAVGLALFLEDQLVEALTYRDFHTFERAYVEDDEPPQFEVHSRLNIFLEGWLETLIDQGYAFQTLL